MASVIGQRENTMRKIRMIQGILAGISLLGIILLVNQGELVEGRTILSSEDMEWIREEKLRLVSRGTVRETSNFIGNVKRQQTNGRLEQVTFVYELGEKECRTNWWYSEEDAKYYLFLPAFMEQETIRVELAGTQTVQWNGKYVSHGDLVDGIEAGHYQLESLDGTRYELEIVSAGNQAAIFVQLEDRLDKVHEDKSLELSGESCIVDADGVIDSYGEITSFRGRGNLSWTFEKKSYQLRFEERTQVLGMTGARQWILLPNYLDRTHLKNEMVKEMAQQISLNYTPESQYLNLYINGEYRGLYQISEKVEIDRARILIDDLEKYTEEYNETVALEQSQRVFYGKEGEAGSYKAYEIEQNPADITGGYLLEAEFLDRYLSEPSGFVSDRGQCVVIQSPKYASVEQVNYIRQLYQDFEDAVYAPDGYHPITGRHYTEYIDLDSFVKKYLAEEVSKNPDAGKTSQFFYKPADQSSTKLFAGPIWDYDYAFGGFRSYNVQSLIHASGLWAAYPNTASTWFAALYQQDDFYTEVVTAYAQQARPVMEQWIETGMEARIAEIEASANMDAIRWNFYSDASGHAADRTAQYKERVDELAQFCQERIGFLDAVWLEEKRAYQVTFELGEAEFYAQEITVVEGACIDIKQDPVYEGRRFLGWKKKGTDQLFDMSTPIQQEGLVLIPVWEEEGQ